MIINHITIKMIKNSFELASGKRSFENTLKSVDRHTADADKPDWLKTLSGETD